MVHYLYSGCVGGWVYFGLENRETQVHGFYRSVGDSHFHCLSSDNIF